MTSTDKHQGGHIKDVLAHADADGKFRRKASTFRSFISADQSAEFPAEANRYILIINLGCPWAHRANIVRSLKGLDKIIGLQVMGFELGERGWTYEEGKWGSDAKDAVCTLCPV